MINSLIELQKERDDLSISFLDYLLNSFPSVLSVMFVLSLFTLVITFFMGIHFTRLVNIRGEKLDSLKKELDNLYENRPSFRDRINRRDNITSLNKKDEQFDYNEKKEELRKGIHELNKFLRSCDKTVLPNVTVIFLISFMSLFISIILIYLVGKDIYLDGEFGIEEKSIEVYNDWLDNIEITSKEILSASKVSNESYHIIYKENDGKISEKTFEGKVILSDDVEGVVYEYYYHPIKSYYKDTFFEYNNSHLEGLYGFQEEVLKVNSKYLFLISGDGDYNLEEGVVDEAG